MHDNSHNDSHVSTSQSHKSSPSIHGETPVVFDLSDRTQIELTGADRAKFLHGFCTNDIKSLQPGQGCEAFLTNIKGRVLAHLFAFAEADSLWLDTVAGQEMAIIQHLDRYVIREDVQLHARSASHGELFVTGNGAAQLLTLDEGLPPYGTVSREAFGIRFQIHRIDVLGQRGFLVSIPREAIESMRQSLFAIGCIAGTGEQFETLRIEAGFPYYGVDITEENLAQEVARTKQCISFTKGCYLGQEPIARLDAMGHTNRELRRVLFGSQTRPTRGALLSVAESDGDAGIVTSVAPLTNERGETVAMAYLKTKFSNPGTIVHLADGQQESAVVLAAAEY